MTEEQRKNIIENSIILLDMKDVMQLTGWCENVVKTMFTHDTDFPAIQKGKKNLVLLDAFKNYLLTRRNNKNI